MNRSSLHWGNVTLANRYLLAPLAGYTTLAFRLAVREVGAPGLATTDLVNARALRHPTGFSDENLGERGGLHDDARHREGRVSHIDDGKHVVEDRLVLARDQRAGVHHEIDLRRALFERL